MARIVFLFGLCFLLSIATSSSVIPILQKVVPSSAPAGGEDITEAVVTGEGFSVEAAVAATLKCRFNKPHDNVKNVVVIATFISNTTIVCKVPASNVVGELELHVTNDGVTFSETSLMFHYYPSPHVIRLIPDSGPTFGETIVQVWGSGFLGNKNIPDRDVRCAFGAVIDVPAEVKNDTLIICITPKVLLPQPELLEITLNGQAYTKNEILFHFYKQPDRIAIIRPERGPMAGGTNATVVGHDFGIFGIAHKYLNMPHLIKCRFGDMMSPQQPVYQSQTIMYCVSPPSDKEGTVLVQITLNDQQYTTIHVNLPDIDNRFTYFKTPFVFDAIPCCGPTSGGTTVTIFGQGFFDQNMGKVEIYFDKYKAHDDEIEIVNRGEIIVKSPPVPHPMKAKVEIYLNGVLFSFGDVYFNYYDNPTSFRIDPPCGPVSVKNPNRPHPFTQITVYGDSFQQSPPENVFCRIGGIVLNATVTTDSTMKCSVPLEAFPKGEIKPVDITMNRVDYASDPKARFSYLESPIIESIRPSSSVLTGGVHVTITGSGFSTNACYFACNFGTTPSVIVNHVSDTKIVVLAPPAIHAEGVPVEVSVNNQDFTDFGKLFFYFEPPRIEKLSPTFSPSHGGARLVVVGSHLLPVADGHVMCRFGSDSSHDAPAEQITLVSVVCITPPRPDPSIELLDVSVTTNFDGESQPVFSNKIPFRYFDAPHVKRVHPHEGPAKGGNYVSVYGEGFFRGSFFDPNHDKVRCKFGDSEPSKPFRELPEDYSGPLSPGDSIMNDTHLLCRVPGVAEPQVVIVQVSLNDETYTTDEVKYSYVDMFIINLGPAIVPLNHSAGEQPMLDVAGFGFLDPSTHDNVHIVCRFFNKKTGEILEEKVLADGSVQENGDVAGEFINSNLIKCPIPQIGEEIDIGVEISLDGGQRFSDSGLVISAVHPPQLVSILPTHGPAKGGSEVVIKVLNLPKESSHTRDNMRVIFFRIKDDPNPFYARARFVDDLHVTCTTPHVVLPQGKSSERFFVNLLYNGHHKSKNTLRFTFFETPRVVSVHPVCGPVHGNTSVEIRGSGFVFEQSSEDSGDESEEGEEENVANVLTRFGPYDTRDVRVMSRTTMIAQTPRVDDLGKELVEVTLNGVDYTDDRVRFTYYYSSVITRVYPIAAPETGGTLIEISGYNFTEDYCALVCRFGDKLSPRVFFRDTVRLYCEAPKGDTGKGVHIQVSFNGQDFTSSGILFRYYTLPSLHYLSPKSGPIRGGTLVHVHGSGFRNPDPKLGGYGTSSFRCKFGQGSKSRLTPAIFESPAESTCVAPRSHGVGQMPIDITMNEIDYSGSFLNFSFYRIDRVEPLAGPVVGSGGINIYGEGFVVGESGGACFFGNAEEKNQVITKPIYISSTHVRCPVPENGGGAGAGAGAVQFKFTLNGQDEFPETEDIRDLYPDLKSPENFKFNYFPTPDISNIHPSSGSALPGTIITISGQNFRPQDAQNAACRFVIVEHDEDGQLRPADEQNAVLGEMHVESPTKATCKIPELPHLKESKAIAVQISFNKQDFSSVEKDSLYSLFGVSSLSPPSIPHPLPVSRTITVHGTGFSVSSSLACRFGSKVIAAHYVNPTTITCELPFDSPVAKIHIEVTIDGEQYTNSGVNLVIYRQPIINRVEPSIGNTIGGDHITVIGSDFRNDLGTIRCRFGDVDSSGSFISPSKIMCKSPPARDLKPGQVRVEISLNGVHFTSKSEALFTYREIEQSGMSGGAITVLVIVCIFIFLLCVLLWWRNNQEQGTKPYRMQGPGASPAGMVQMRSSPAVTTSGYTQGQSKLRVYNEDPNAN